MASATVFPFERTWEHRLAFTVLGVPAPKGSMKGFVFMRGGRPRAALTNANPKTRSWEQAVAGEAFVTKRHQAPITDAVRLVIWFYFPRPKSAPKRVIVPIAQRNDIDKLSRALMDALKKGGVYQDDGLVIDLAAYKRFAGGWGDPEGARGLPRAEIQVQRLV